MIVTNPKDALHKSWLIRLLIALADKSQISRAIYFKGGTCATMRGFLDRFSVDLDFDLDPSVDKSVLRKLLGDTFEQLGLEIKDESQHALQFFLRYDNKEHLRNTLKLEILDTFMAANDYEPTYLPDIDRTMKCQTIETMFAHKLVAVTDRFEQTGHIAGRDLYDLNHFFLQGYSFKPEIVVARTQKSASEYLQFLEDFIQERVSQQSIDQDLNTLLSPQRFHQIRSSLKAELLSHLRNRISANLDL